MTHYRDPRTRACPPVLRPYAAKDTGSKAGLELSFVASAILFLAAVGWIAWEAHSNGVF